MDLALKVSKTSTPQLDTGIADKLRAAATSMGTHVIPSGDVEANGMLWRLMATYARLNTSELLALIMWLEVAYSATMSARAAAHLPNGLVSAVALPNVNAAAPAVAASAAPVYPRLPQVRARCLLLSSR